MAGLDGDDFSSLSMPITVYDCDWVEDFLGRICPPNHDPGDVQIWHVWLAERC